MTISTSTYRESLHPWTIFRILATRQVVVGTFRSRNDADAQCRVLQQLLPDNHYVVTFEPPILQNENGQQRGDLP